MGMLNKETLCDMSSNQPLLITTNVTQLCALPLLCNSQSVSLANLSVAANVIIWLQVDILQLLHQLRTSSAHMSRRHMCKSCIVCSLNAVVKFNQALQISVSLGKCI